MTRDELRSVMTDATALTCTLFGEAQGEPIQGQIAVGCVIRNRAIADFGKDGKPDWWGEGIKGVCLAKAQFSCWWERGQNTDRVYALAEALIQRQPVGANVFELRWVAEGIIGGALRDVTRAIGGADSYLTTTLLRTSPPDWAKTFRPSVVIGNHTFFKLY